MPDTQRQPGLGLIGQLLAEPHRFAFFQAVRLLEQWLRDYPQEPPLRLRFRNRLSLAFPPGEIAALERTPGEIAITPAFTGLLGSAGALPYHYTERIAEHEHREGDEGPRAFLDLLSERALSMFCLAWARHRPECMRGVDGGDGFLALLLSLSGAQPSAHSAVARETFARYAVQASSRTVSAQVMEGVLTEYFGVPFRVEALVGIWETLPLHQQSQLGVANCTLGRGAMTGPRVHRCDTRARIRIGPLDRATYERFLPRSEGAAALEAMLGMFCFAGISFEVRLILRAEDVHGFSLHPSARETGVRLGVDAFLLRGPSPSDRDDLSYLLHP